MGEKDRRKRVKKPEKGKLRDIKMQQAIYPVSCTRNENIAGNAILTPDWKEKN